jgi:uncharacterized YceG family protein
VEEREPDLTPSTPRPPGRRRATRRRAGAALLLLGLLGAGIWAASTLVHGDAKPASTPAATVPQLVQMRVIFPEGFTRPQMADRVDAVRALAIATRGVTPRLTRAGYLRASRAVKPPAGFRSDSPRSIEGFLFPATYDFTQNTTAAELVHDQLAFFREEWAKVDLSYPRSKDLTPYDVLTIASMIEKEAVVPEERRLIAAVIYNRLRLGMPLGIDATIRYGRGVPGNQPLKVSDLESNTPYNTRTHVGLPPTPISNPGLASIRAAAHPAKVDYLYFVRKHDKIHHFFTASEAEFLRKKCEYGYGC